MVINKESIDRISNRSWFPIATIRIDRGWKMTIAALLN